MKTIVKVLLSMLTMVLLSQCEKDELSAGVTILDNKFLKCFCVQVRNRWCLLASAKLRRSEALAPAQSSFCARGKLRQHD